MPDSPSRECTDASTDALLAVYRDTASALRRVLDLADIAAEYRHPWRAADHLVGLLDELEDQLAILRTNRSP